MVNLFIADKSPDKAVDWLVENTNKNFCFKQLLELGQLICSAGISDVYKRIKQGNVLKAWIVKNPYWTKCFFLELLVYCFYNLNLKEKTLQDLKNLYFDLSKYCVKIQKFTYSDLKTAIWRYSKEYGSEYPTNSALDIDLVCELYKKYITEFKFKKSEV